MREFRTVSLTLIQFLGVPLTYTEFFFSPGLFTLSKFHNAPWFLCQATRINEFQHSCGDSVCVTGECIRTHNSRIRYPLNIDPVVDEHIIEREAKKIWHNWNKRKIIRQRRKKKERRTRENKRTCTTRKRNEYYKDWYI